MSTIKRIGDLEIDQDLRFQRKFWKWQRSCWVVMAAIALAAILGLFGTGFLSQSQVSNLPQGLELQYERFGRISVPCKLIVQIQPSNFQQKTVQVQLSRSYLEFVKPEQITPEPSTVLVGNQWLTYEFQLDNSHAPVVITFNVEPQRAGYLSGQIQIPQGTPLAFNQLIYP